MSEELVSAERRKWLVAVQCRTGFLGPKPQVLIVNAYSENQAKRIAIKQLTVGPYKYRTPSMWEVTSCEELKNE